VSVQKRPEGFERRKINSIQPFGTIVSTLKTLENWALKSAFKISTLDL